MITISKAFGNESLEKILWFAISGYLSSLDLAGVSYEINHNHAIGLGLQFAPSVI